MTSARLGKKTTHQDWYQHGQEIHHHIHSRKPKQSSEPQQKLRRPRAGTEPPEQSSRGCVHQEAKKKKKMVLGQRALEQETPVLWLHTWHDQSDLVTDARHLQDFLCNLKMSCANCSSSSSAGKGVMDTPCTMENTQIDTGCREKKDITGHRYLSEPRAVTYPQDVDV